jgi:broad specificity phosphatase PhoE
MSNPSASTSCTMYLIRHGATENNLKKPAVLQGKGLNGPLSPTGLDQAQQTAQFLASHPISAIYSSPMLRAMQTAEAISSKHTQLKIAQVPTIIEVDVGNWEGRDWGDIQTNDPEEYEKHMSDPSKFPYPGGESMQQVQQRCVPELLRILHANTGHIVVTAHNVVNRSMVAHLLNSPLKQARQIRQDNCGINVIRRKGDKVELMTVNSVFHLG